MKHEKYCPLEDQSGMEYNVDEAGVWVDCVRERRPVIHNDYPSLTHRQGVPEGHAQITRELVVSIMRQGKIVAILGVGNKPQYYTDKDVELVTHFADIAWEVAERKSLEEQYQDLLESTDTILWEYDITEDKWTYISPQVEKILGFSPEEWSNLEFWINRIHLEDRKWAAEFCRIYTNAGGW